MPPPRKTEPQVVWITIAGVAVLAVFVAYCWWGSYHPEFVPVCNRGTMKGVPTC
jgi:hypothetical protein